MLSFGITHRLTDLLIAIESSTHFYGRVLPVLTAVIVTPHHDDASWLDAEPVPVPDHAWHTHPGGTTAVLTTLATALRCPAGTQLLARARRAQPGAWILAYALSYQYQGWAGPVRCVDAVDTDQRLYRVSRAGWHGQVSLSIHDDPEAHDPPTRAALADLLAATR